MHSNKKAQGIAGVVGSYLLLFFLILGVILGLAYLLSDITESQKTVDNIYTSKTSTGDFTILSNTTVNGKKALVLKNIGNSNLVLRTLVLNTTPGASFAGTGINTSWKYSQDVRITNSGLTTLTNFPVYLKIPFHTGMRSDFNDLRFGLGTCNQTNDATLSFELENVTANGFANVWLNLQSFTPGTNQICMYYGYLSASSGSNSKNTWNKDYLGVWHLEEIYTSAQKDSTKYLANMTPRNYDTNKDIAGIIGRAENHDGVDDFLNISSAAVLKMPHMQAPQTIEAWAYYTASPAGNRHLFLFSNMGTSGATSFGFRAGSTLAWYWGGNAIVAWAALPTINAWHHYVYTRNTTTNILYVDGIQKATTNTIPRNYWPTSASINSANWGENFQGRIDEVRISNTSRSADWIKNTYQLISNQSNKVVLSSSNTIGWSKQEKVLCFDIYANDVLLQRNTDFDIVLPLNLNVKYTLLPSMDSADIVFYNSAASISGTLIKVVSCDGVQRYYKMP